jgi:hypothetical protein
MMPRNGSLTKLTPFGGIPTFACVVPDLFGLTEAISKVGGVWAVSAAKDNAKQDIRRERTEILLSWR